MIVLFISPVRCDKPSLATAGGGDPGQKIHNSMVRSMVTLDYTMPQTRTVSLIAKAKE